MSAMSQRIILMLAVLSLVVGSWGTAAAQESTPAPDGVLAQATVASLPSPDAEVWFLRVTLEPGGSLPADEQIGPTLFVVESGTVTVGSDPPPILVQQGAGPAAMPVTESALAARDFAAVEGGTSLTLRNEGTEAASLLALFVIDPRLEGTGEEGSMEEPVGMTMTGIAVGHGAFPEGGGTLTIERVTIQPGDESAASLQAGAEVGAVEQGTLLLNVSAGAGFVWPGMMALATGADGEGEEAAPQRIEVQEQGEFTLTANDGYALSNATATWEVTGDAPVTILRATVVPLAPEVATPSP
jgi:hypothetical protein